MGGIVLAIIGIAATFLITRHYYLKQAKETVGGLETELRRSSERILNDIDLAAQNYRRTDDLELARVRSRASDQGFRVIARTLEQLDTPLRLHNEAVANFEKDIDEILQKYGDECVRDALGEEVDRMSGTIRTVRDWLYDGARYAHWSHPHGGWLKAICIVFQGCGTFPKLGDPPNHEGGTLINLDGDRVVLVSEDVLKEAANVFQAGQAALEKVRPFQANLREISSQTRRDLGEIGS